MRAAIDLAWNSLDMTPLAAPSMPALPPILPTLDDRIAGCPSGAAVSDALGGPVGGYSPGQIVERHGGRLSGIVGPWNEDWRTARQWRPAGPRTASRGRAPVSPGPGARSAR